MRAAAHSDHLAILHRLKEGDTFAFLQVYNHYHKALYCYVLRFIKIPSLAEDIVHDVFLKVWEVRKDIKPELSFTTYLYQITRNKVFKILKRIANERELRSVVLREVDSSGIANIEQLLEWQKYEGLLHEAVAQLPPQRQKVFRMCREEGKSYDEVSDELGISRNTIKEHMVLAMKTIKEFFSAKADVTLTVLIVLSAISGSA